MVFTLGAELRKMRAEAHEQGRKEERITRDKQWDDWLKAVMPDLISGREPRIPRPSADAREWALARARDEEERKWMEWYKAVKPDLDAGRHPSILPPTDRNGTGNAGGE